ncbi:MAG: ATP-binding protein [Parachlamydiales bacterium]|nr:ATP-binding protein [Parachlamydiales bacterium]
MEDKLKETKSFNAQLENLYPMLIWIRERVAKYFNQKVLEEIELACEEAIVNIIIHGYKNEKGHKISIQIHINQVLEISFKDKAKEFNPLLKKPKIIQKNLPLNKRKEGGLGLHIILNYMDDVKYQRQNDFNILTLIKKRSLNY